MNLPFHDQGTQRLEEALRAGARAFGPEPPIELRARILAAVRGSPRLAPVPGPSGRERAGTWLAAAAAVLVLGGAWWLARVSAPPAERRPSLVRLSRGVLGAGKSVLELPGEVEGSLRLEAERLLSDTTRVARGVVRSLPAPLRERIERM